MRASVFARMLANLARGVRSIGYGQGVRDKLWIAAMLALYMLFPLGSLARRVGRPLPDLFRLVRSYTCRNQDGIFVCPSGPHFVFCDPSHDPGVRAVITHVDRGVFVDVGASVGFFTILAARRLSSSGRVVAIEPHPERYQCLRENIKINRLTNVGCLQVAASEANGHLTMYEPEPTFGPHRRDVSVGATSGRRFEVNARTIDSIIEELGIHGVTLVKIDVEGFEPSVIRGMSILLKTSLPRVVFEALSPESLRESSAALAEFDYVVRQLDASNFLAESRCDLRAGA